MSNKITVLVVEDSFLMRKILSDIINSDPDLEVVGVAKDGKEALEKVAAFQPDVITLDMNLPLEDGLSVLKGIMQRQPRRVIMVSAYTRVGASATIKALELGAVDFIAKPSGEVSLDLRNLKDEIIAKIKWSAAIDLDKFVSKLKPAYVSLISKEKKPGLLKKLVVIGASTGGPKAVLEVMRDMPIDLPVAFLIVQHMPEGFTLSFAERLSWQSGIRTKEVENDDVILAGKAFVAPAGYHMLLEKQAEEVRVKLNQDERVNFVRPSIDVTMNSATEVFGKNIIGVILTGMGHDGLEGARRIKQKGGFIIIQDEESSVIWGMPRAVYEAGLADRVLPLSKIAPVIVEEIEKDT